MVTPASRVFTVPISTPGAMVLSAWVSYRNMQSGQTTTEQIPVF
jgi:hypothetical protein